MSVSEFTEQIEQIQICLYQLQERINQSLLTAPEMEAMFATLFEISKNLNKLQLNYNQLHNKNQELLSLVSNYYKLVEQNLHMKNEHSSCSSEAKPTGILLHEKGIIIETNQIFAQMLGYKASEIVGMQLIRLLAPTSRMELVNYIASENHKIYQVIFLRKNGSILPVELHDRTIHYQGRKFRVAAVKYLPDRQLAA